jgi:hypothetical protein
MSQTIPFETLEKEWKKNPDYVQEYENLRPEFEMARELIHARSNDLLHLLKNGLCCGIGGCLQ